MKNSSATQPRLMCRLVRGSLAIFGDTSTGEPRGLGASHAAACPDCREFFGACDELTLALKRDAARDFQEPPGNLEQNILRAINLSIPQQKPRTSHAAWLSFAGVGVCAALALIVVQRQPATNSLPATTPAGAVATSGVSPQELWESVKPTAGAVIDGEPLQNEVDAVVANARSAMKFLALNFLPDASGETQSSGNE